MRRVIFLILVLLLSLSLYAGRSATPHPVYIELHNSEGKIPAQEDLNVKCWLKHKPEQILTLEDPNLLYPIHEMFLQIQCSGFDSWDAGDLLIVEIEDIKSGEFIFLSLELTYENFQLFGDNRMQKQEVEE